MIEPELAKEQISPIWQLFAPNDDPLEARVGIHLCVLPDPTADWEAALAAAERRVLPGDVLVIACERALPRAILGILARRRNQRRPTPSSTQLEAALGASGFELLARYSMWPSAQAPRIFLPAGELPGLRWVQRSGVLGGGGNRLVARALARSVLFTPLAASLTPAFALVSRRAR